MNLLRSLLKLWLKLECQMITSCSAGLLVKLSDEGDHTVMAGWPAKNAIDKAMIVAASTVMSKKRVHLEKAGKEEDGHLYLGHPIFVDDIFWGVIVLNIQKSGTKDMQAVLKILQWGLTWLRFLLYQNEIEVTGSTLAENQGVNPAQTTDQNQGLMISFLAAVLKEKSTEETAIAVVNYIASQFQFDRVSLGLLRANKIQLTAVSFSASFDSRTQPMQNIIDAMEETTSQRTGIQLGTKVDSKNLESPSKHITRCHQLLLENHRLNKVSTYLLRRDDQILGALTIEQAKTNRITDDVHNYIEKSLSLVASIFYFKLQAQLGLKQKVRHTFLDFLRRSFGANHPIEKLLAISALCFLVILFIPANYRVSSDAVLQSTNKHLLVSPHDGFIGQVYVKPGDTVKQAQLLVSLKDEELKLERRIISSQLQQYRLEYDNALAGGDRAQAAILNSQVDQGKAELSLIEQKLERTRLKSPIDGVIVSDDISQSLGAPTKQGEVLFEIADNKEFFVQLFVNEKNISNVKIGQSGKLNLSSLPGEKFEFIVDRITPISELRDGNNYFRLDAKLTSPTDILRPGMTGTGKIDIEKRALGWIFFHEIWHWFRLTLWF